MFKLRSVVAYYSAEFKYFLVVPALFGVGCCVTIGQAGQYITTKVIEINRLV